MTITIGDAVKLIEDKRKAEAQKHLKTFKEDSKLEVMNGRYGPYLAYDGTNYRLAKNLHERVMDLTYDECMKISTK
jgi:DNA topoisomerase-1